eukprot:5726894-Lingulodinium_polyedra.AAC.1
MQRSPGWQSPLARRGGAGSRWYQIPKGIVTVFLATAAKVVAFPGCLAPGYPRTLQRRGDGG